MYRAVLAQKVAQVSVRSEFDDDVEWAVLSAAAEQIENVGVFADHLHHLHFRDEVHQFRVRVALCWQSIKKRNVKTTTGLIESTAKDLPLSILTATVVTAPCLRIPSAWAWTT